MRKTTRMMMITGRNGRDNRRDYGRSEGGEMNYGRRGGSMDYEPESRRDYGRSDGEMNYPYMNTGRGNRYGANNRDNYARGNRMEMEREYTRNEYNGSDMNYGVEGRFRDRRGREHYDNGRFAPMRSEMDEDWDVEGHHMPHYPSPVWGDPGMNGGFMAGFNGERGFRSDAGYQPMNEMERNPGMMQGTGGAHGMEVMPMDKRKAEAWVNRMHNTDGSTGPHWTMEKTRQLAQQKGIDEDPVEFWTTMNMLYSDYGKVAQKHGLQNNIDFFVDLAQAFLDDKDAQEDKLARYYQYIAKK